MTIAPYPSSSSRAGRQVSETSRQRSKLKFHLSPLASFPCLHLAFTSAFHITRSPQTPLSHLATIKVLRALPPSSFSPPQLSTSTRHHQQHPLQLNTYRKIHYELLHHPGTSYLFSQIRSSLLTTNSPYSLPSSPPWPSTSRAQALRSAVPSASSLTTSAWYGPLPPFSTGIHTNID